MSDRDRMRYEAAMLAMSALIQRDAVIDTECAASKAVAFADALLRQLERSTW